MTVGAEGCVKCMRDADTDQQGIKVGGRNISFLRYADDTALKFKLPNSIVKTSDGVPKTTRHYTY